MAMRQVFVWNTYLETGLSEIDRQHQHLVDLINGFGELLAHDHVKSEDIEQLLAELVDYAGDAVLCALARELTYAVRTDDFVCRLGGDEFLVICPGTDHIGALHLAKQIHRHISALKIPAGEGFWQGSLSLSLGVAVRDPAMSSYEELIKLADRSVYAAKGAGRNCVRSAN